MMLVEFGLGAHYPYTEVAAVPLLQLPVACERLRLLQLPQRPLAQR